MLLKKTNSSDSLKQPSINSEENNDLTGKLIKKARDNKKDANSKLYKYDRTGKNLTYNIECKGIEQCT